MVGQPSYEELIEKVRSLEKEVISRRRAEAINRILFTISSAVNTSSNLDELYASIHKALDNIIDVSNFFISLYNEGNQILEFPYFVDEFDQTFEIQNLDNTSSLTAHVFKTGKPLLIDYEQIQNRAKKMNKPTVGAPCKKWLGVPLKLKDRVIGVMATQNYTNPDGLTEKDVSLMLSVADQVAMAIENKRTEEALRKSNDKLEKRVEKRTRELRKINEQLKKEMKERILLEKELIRTERLAATGRLAATVAHEINSPLQGITSILAATKRLSEKNQQALDNIDLVEIGIKRIGDTVNKLLDLNRPSNEKKQPCQINRIIQDTVTLSMDYLKKNRIKVRLDFDDQIPDISVSPQEFGTLFMNLINNAAEAMRDETKRNQKSAEKNSGAWIFIKSRLIKDTIFINIRDTGPGIPENDIEKIFDPFYTNKQRMGMGVGLSICHNIIKNHGGSIMVENHPSGGAIFRIGLPLFPKGQTGVTDEDIFHTCG